MKTQNHFIAAEKAKEKEATDKTAEDEAARKAAEEEVAAKKKAEEEAAAKKKAEEEAAAAKEKAEKEAVAAKEKAEKEAADKTEKEAAAKEKAEEEEIRRDAAKIGAAQRQEYVHEAMKTWTAGEKEAAAANEAAAKKKKAEEEAAATAKRADSALKNCDQETSRLRNILGKISAKRPEMAQKVADGKEQTTANTAMQEQFDVVSEASFDPDDHVSRSASPAAGESAKDLVGFRAAYAGANEEIQQLKRQIQELSKTVHDHKQTIEQLRREKSKSEQKLRIAEEAKDAINTCYVDECAKVEELKKTTADNVNTITSLTTKNAFLQGQVDLLMIELKANAKTSADIMQSVQKAHMEVNEAETKRFIAEVNAHRHQQFAKLMEGEARASAFRNGSMFGAAIIQDLDAESVAGASQVLQGMPTAAQSTVPRSTIGNVTVTDMVI
jgi:hypothetical protein